MSEVLAALIGLLIGSGIGLYVTSRWAGEAFGQSIQREIDAGRLTTEQARSLIEGLSVKR